ncbi:hypothetical protein A1O1_08939 [Capronia coronata CBS 617.96]|uniref:Glycine zipper 2TM domain-containing protein n=1 Tax=Capronia coronata CBS 617.96 TaxID=1182541 RepID=W9XEB8_9EURO|nr:uncharacterized protein A1O1_08939 [Capronia coronata CBS 617.96]EXJ78538.1 hypothetical protein A1O1_08939 [Capronia coronata CBS 617.96]
MSGPYDSYSGYGQQAQYPPQPGYGSGYPPQQGYDQGYQQSQYPEQGYSQYPQDQNYGPPRRQDSFGPPQHGGFQHGQAGGQFGAYDASNPQGHPGYYGQLQPQHQGYGGGGGNDAYAQNQAYQAQLAQGGGAQQPGTHLPDASQHQFQAQSSDPNAPNYDPNAPPMTETDRGLLGAIGGGFGGHMLGKKANHGFLGTVGGAILGSITEDFLKDKKKKHNSSTNSSWGGGRY